MLNETAPTQNTVVITLSAYDEDQPGVSRLDQLLSHCCKCTCTSGDDVIFCSMFIQSQNSDLVWLAPTVDNPFHLDASTGVITLQSPLDHEADPEYIVSLV